MGGATVPANAEMPGLAAIVMEVAVLHKGKEMEGATHELILGSAALFCTGLFSHLCLNMFEPFQIISNHFKSFQTSHCFSTFLYCKGLRQRTYLIPVRYLARCNWSSAGTRSVR